MDEKGHPPRAEGLRVAIIAGGKLLLQQPDGSRRAITSDFVQDMIDRAERRKARHGWKDDSVGWNTSAVPSEIAALSLATAQQGGERMSDFVDVAPLDGNRMLYALRAEAFGGLFEYTIDRAEERRLAHKAEYRIAEIDARRGDGRLISSLSYDDGTANLATLRADGGRLRAITEGDSIDQAPSWVRDDSETIVYQSAGIARDVHGYAADLSPFRIESLDLGSGDHDVLAESETHDLLMPTRLADGTLYFVRRPHEPLYREPTAAQHLKDFALFPVRLAVGVFWFLNAFTKFFSNQPLSTAGGPKREGPTARQLVLYGRVIEMQKRSGRGAPRAASVPSSWELVSRSPQGDERVEATGVGHYDLADDGTLVYTDGQRVTCRRPDGVEQELLREPNVERVRILG